MYYNPHPLKVNYKGCMECHIQFYGLEKWRYEMSFIANVPSL